ncbi:MAG: four helix bundle protein [Deltaproteobacteria bacterium]|nr:four helix bundle protein [Deltaproteobacteria bacterium]
MNPTTNGPRFRAHDLALEALTLLRPLLAPIRAVDRSLADQLQRAATSVALNIAEGSHRRGRDRAHFYRVAAGSAAESRTCLEAATALGHVDAAASAVAWHTLDQVIAILWRVTH